jgi:hypothetical protein
MYYLKIRDTEAGGNSLVYYCRNCGHEDTTLTAESVCVSETQLRRSEQKYSHIVNEFTKFDPTLPRINTIKCPNQECSSNKAAGQSGGGRKTKAEESGKAAADTKEPSKAAAEPSKKKNPLKIKTKKNESAAQASAAQASAAQASAAQASAAQASAAQAQAEAEINEILAEEDKEAAEELAEQQGEQSSNENENEREVIYIRYDDINMKYVYLCVHCDTTWKTDNR